jgi:hypothetical protein
MDTALFVLITLFVGAIAIAFYMDWSGLWVSKEELANEIARSKETTQGPGQPFAVLARESSALVPVEIGTKDSRVA